MNHGQKCADCVLGQPCTYILCKVGGDMSAISVSWRHANNDRRGHGAEIATTLRASLPSISYLAALRLRGKPTTV